MLTPTADTISIALGFFGGGLLLGVVYDVFRAVRLLKPPGKAAAAAQDILFALICMFAGFSLILILNNGEIRTYILLSGAAGFALYYFTLGRLTVKILRPIAVVVRAVVLGVIKAFLFPFRLIFKLFYKIGRYFGKKVSSTAKKLKIFSEKPDKFYKKPLQNVGRLLYNKNNIRRVFNRSDKKVGIRKEKRSETSIP